MTATTELLLRAAYADYCTSVSPRTMAADIREVAFLYDVCREREARSVADFGSGFSSFVLAHYAAMAPYDVVVTSVDDDARWLEATALFLRRYGFRSSTLMLWDDWLSAGLSHDVGFYDLASGDKREAGMLPVAEACGVVLFDDAQHPLHAAQMRVVAGVTGKTLVDVQARTEDQVGRFGALLA